jgi:hypothetical protein
MKRISLLLILALLCLMPASSTGFGVLPTINSDAANGWIGWDEKNQTGWGSPSANITIYDGANSTNETGEGVVTGVNLVHTQAGGVGAAVNDGGYYYRPMDGIDDVFSPTGLWFDGMFKAQAKWFIGIKAYLDSTDHGYVFIFRNNATTASMYVSVEAGHELTFYCRDTENALENQTTTGSSTLDQVLWICMWCDGITVRAGFYIPAVVGQHPTKWSDFAATNRITFAALFDNFGQMNGDVQEMSLFKQATNYAKGHIYAVVAASECLINNNL